MTKSSERILMAAAEQFLAHGYDATRLDEIVSHARVSKTAIYKYYGGKRELFIALAEYLSNQLLAQTTSNKPFTIAAREDLEKILRNVGRDYLDCALSHDNLAKFRMTLAMANRVEEVAQKFYYLGHVELCKYIARYLHAANDANITAIQQPGRAAAHFLALLRSEIHLRAVFDISYHPSPEDKTEAIEEAVNLFLHGYLSA